MERPASKSLMFDGHPEDSMTMQTDGMAYGKHGPFDPREITVREAGGGVHIDVGSIKPATSGEAPVQLRLPVGEMQRLMEAVAEVTGEIIRRRNGACQPR